jgi:hypothetical protein
MKITRIIIAISLALGCSLFCSAKIIQVTSVGASASTILTPGFHVHTITIQNNGSGDVRLGIDGGTTNGLTDPTATTGYLLKAGSQLIITYSGTTPQLKIRAILVSGTTTTIDICTDDAQSS